MFQSGLWRQTDVAPMLNSVPYLVMTLDKILDFTLPQFLRLYIGLMKIVPTSRIILRIN